MKDKAKLEKLLDKEYIYKQENIRIKDYYFKEETKSYKIITDGTPIEIEEAGVDNFIKKLLPVTQPESAAALSIVSESRNTINSLKDILMDNIKKVQTNKDYIGQAKMVNNSVNSLLNMVSLELKIRKEGNKQ